MSWLGESKRYLALTVGWSKIHRESRGGSTHAHYPCGGWTSSNTTSTSISTSTVESGKAFLFLFPDPTFLLLYSVFRFMYFLYTGLASLFSASQCPSRDLYVFLDELELYWESCVLQETKLVGYALEIEGAKGWEHWEQVRRLFRNHGWVSRTKMARLSRLYLRDKVDKEREHQ